MTYDELLQMYFGAGGGARQPMGGDAEFGSYNANSLAMTPNAAVNIPGVGSVMQDENGVLQVGNRFDGGANGAGGTEGYTIAQGGTATPYRYDDPARDTAGQLRDVLGSLAPFALGGMGLEGMLGGLGGASSGAGFVGEGAMSGIPAWDAVGSAAAGMGGEEALMAAAQQGLAGSGGWGSGVELMPGVTDTAGGMFGAQPELGFGTGALGPGGAANFAVGAPLPGEVGFGTGAVMPGPAPGVGGALGSIGSALGSVGSTLSGLAGGVGAAAGGFDWSKLIPGAIGAGLGALGSGDRTQTSNNLMDPSARAYLDSFRGRAEQVASQPYQAPGFSLTQDPTAQQTQAANTLSGLIGNPQSQSMQNTLAGYYEGRPGFNGVAAVNPFVADANPYLTGMIDSATGDINRAYANMVAPKFSAGSSFGNSGLGFAEVEARNDLARQLGNAVTGLRFSDHNMRAGLAESGAARTDNMFNSNANRSLAAVGLGQQGVRDQANIANGLFGMGANLWNQGQQNIQNQYAEFDRSQNWSRNQLSAMNPGLGVGMNAGQSVTTPGNRAAGALGGFTLGMQARNLFG